MGEIQVTPQGGVRIPATFAKPGVYPYSQPDGSWRMEYRSPAAVADPEFLRSIAGAPVTMGHPRERLVSTSTWKGLAIGHAADGPAVLADGRAGGAVYVMDEAAIIAIGKDGPQSPRQISPGLRQQFVASPGVTPEGVKYDGIQTMLRCNHIALVPRGRQGESVGLRLDSAGDEIPPDFQDTVPMKITIAGKSYEAGSQEAEKALADLQTRLDAAERTSATAQATAAEVARLRKDRLAHLRADLHRVKIDVRNDADEAALMAEALTKMVPGFSVDGQSPDYVMGAFAAALAMLLADDEADDKAAGAKPPAPQNQGANPQNPAPGAGAAGAEQVRNDAIEARNAGAAKHSLGLSGIEKGPSDIARERMVNAGRSMKIRPE